MKLPYKVAAVLLLFAVIIGCTENGAWDTITARLEPPPEEEPPPPPPPDPEELFGPWKTRLSITYETTATSTYLFDVPLLVTVDGGNFRYDVTDGSDIAFYAQPYSQAAEPLDHECSRWDPGGTSVFWVRAPMIVPGEPFSFWMYAGSDSLGEAENPSGVWRNGYVVVMHFDDETDLYRDSSPFANHGVNWPQAEGTHTPAGVGSGLVGGAALFDDRTDAVKIAASESISNMRPFTLQTWLQLRDYASGSRLLSKGNRFLYYKSSGGLKVQTRIQHWVASLGNDPISNSTIADDFNDVFHEGVFPHLAPEAGGGYRWASLNWVWSGDPFDAATTVTLGDGSGAGSWKRSRTADYSFPDSQLGAPLAYDGEQIAFEDDSGRPLVIGNGDWAGATASIEGLLDELRISIVERSADWLRFQQEVITSRATSYDDLELIWDDEYL